MVLVIISLEEVYVYHVQESRGSLAQLERELDMMVKGEHVAMLSLCCMSSILRVLTLNRL